MKKNKPIKNWRLLLNRWISGEADYDDERSLEALAKEDPFLTDALEGYRSLPEADHARAVGRLKARLRKRNRGGGFHWWRVAAIGVLLVAAWLVLRTWEPDKKGKLTEVLDAKQQLENARQEKSAALNVQDSIKMIGPSTNQLFYQKNKIKTDEIKETTSGSVSRKKDFDKNENALPTPAGPVEKTRQAPSPPQPMEEDMVNEFQTEEELARVDKSAPEQENAPPPANLLPDTPPGAPAAKAETLAMDKSQPVNSVEEKAAPVKIVRGQVMDENGQPLIGATVQILHSTYATVTDVQGRFKLDAPIENPVLSVSYTGFQTQHTPVPESGFVDVRLSESIAALDEVTVTRSRKKSKPTFEPQGGFKKYEKYIRRNLRMPAAAKEAGVKGKVTIGFYLNSDGRPTRVEVIKSLGYGCDEEAVRLIKNGPKWKGQPGKFYTYMVEF